MGGGTGTAVMSHLVVLDNEAVQALASPTHPKHRKVLAHVQVVTSRKRRAMQVSLVVPTTVRVEAGWDRSAPACVFLNRMRIADVPLDTAQADFAASIRNHAQVSVADAHLGAVFQESPANMITVVTSDPADMRKVAGDKNVTVATI